MEVIVTIKDCLKNIPKDAKILIGTREHALKKVVHLEGNVYLASLMDGGKGFDCKVSAEHDVITPVAASKHKDGGKNPVPTELGKKIITEEIKKNLESKIESKKK